MSSERTHVADDAAAEPASVPPRGAAALCAVLGNRAVGRLARAATPSAAVTNPVVGNRARVQLLGRIIHENEDILRPGPDRSYSPKSSDLRDAVLENAEGLVPATEGETKFYLGVDKESIEKGRKWAAGRGTTYTDCIDFAVRRLAVGLSKIKKKAALPSPVFPDNSKAFVRAYEGMAPGMRPSPGDIFIMHSRNKDGGDSGNFAHTGVIKEILPGDGGTETWSSYDGGQGSATKLQHLEKSRQYDPNTNVFGGKWLYGWIDVDLV